MKTAQEQKQRILEQERTVRLLEDQIRELSRLIDEGNLHMVHRLDTTEERLVTEKRKLILYYIKFAFVFV